MHCNATARDRVRFAAAVAALFAAGCSTANVHEATISDRGVTGAEDGGVYDATSSSAVDSSGALGDATTADVSVESGSTHDATSELDAGASPVDAYASLDGPGDLEGGFAPDAAPDAGAPDDGAPVLDGSVDSGQDAGPSIPLCATGQPMSVYDGGVLVCEGCPPEDYPFGCGTRGICVDLNTDPNNCGGCGIVCATYQLCQGSCVDAPCVAFHVQQPIGAYGCLGGSAVYKCEAWTGFGWVEAYNCTSGFCYVSPPDDAGGDCTMGCCR